MAKSKQKLKRVIVVSNRTDQVLQRHIAKTLAARVTWVVAKPRRIQSAAKSVEKGRFDIVILLTGFLDHKTTEQLVTAAKKSETPLVRANRGRAGALDQALERDLKPGEGKEAESQVETEAETEAEATTEAEAETTEEKDGKPATE